MLGCFEIKKCKKKLAEMKREEEKVECSLERLERKYSSHDWPGYDTGSVSRFADRYTDCPSSKEKDEIIKLCNKLDDISAKIESFIEKEYSEEVFRVYSKKKPKLVRISTDEVFTWEDAFGTDFDKLEKGLKYSLVGLVEKPTRYRFK